MTDTLVCSPLAEVAQQLTIFAADEAAMQKLGQLFATSGISDVTVFLHGNLGMGKTTLSRGIIRGFGHTGSVKSPTYTLVEPYTVAGQQIYHFDLYRLADPEELEYIGIRDYFSEPAVRLIEWPEKGAGMLPHADVEIDIELQGQGRQLTLQPFNDTGVELVKKLQQQIALSK